MFCFIFYDLDSSNEFDFPINNNIKNKVVGKKYILDILGQTSRLLPLRSITHEAFSVLYRSCRTDRQYGPINMTLWWQMVTATDFEIWMDPCTKVLIYLEK